MKYSVVMTALICLSTQISAQKLNRKERKMESRIQKDIAYLASDELEGRLTGSEGELKSARYIASKFKSMGLKPLGDTGSYFQVFEITTLRIATDNSVMQLGGMKLTQFADFYPISISANQAEFTGPTVDVGFGINSENPKRNDYAGKDVKGKLVIINLGSPDGIHPHSAFISWHGIEKRVNEAIRMGAAAVVFYRESEKVEAPSGELSLKTESCAIPVVYVTRELKSLPPGSEITLKIDILAIQEKGHNVIGFKDNKAKNTVVIGAHHDHLGRGEMGNSLSIENNAIHNGADDNASGTSGLLELAKIYAKKRRWNKANNYLFIAFSGEELGLIGSKHYMNHPTLPIESMNYMINMDMIGKLDSSEKTLAINGVGTSPAWRETIKTIKLDTNKIREIVTTEGGIGASDHTSFYLKNIPAIHFFTGQHSHYHKPSDDISLINYKGEVFVIKYICNFIADLNDKGKLAFTETKNEDKTTRAKLNVTLGIMPDYMYSGEGLKVDGVKDNMPGSVAGLLKDDVIISLNGVFIKNMKDYMHILGELKQGDLVPMQVNRNNEVIKLNVQF